MKYGIVLNGLKFTKLIADEKLMSQAEILSKNLKEAGLSEFVTSIEMDVFMTHISTTSERSRIMRIAQDTVSSDIICD